MDNVFKSVLNEQKAIDTQTSDEGKIYFIGKPQDAIKVIEEITREQQQKFKEKLIEIIKSDDIERAVRKAIAELEG